MRIFIYALLFILGYRILKKFFAPNFGNIQRPQDEQPFQRPSNTADKSNVIEDVDYEEIKE